MSFGEELLLHMWLAADDLELLAVEKMMLQVTSGRLIETGRSYGTERYVVKTCVSVFL
jgi:hypothetical protein